MASGQNNPSDSYDGKYAGYDQPPSYPETAAVVGVEGVHLQQPLITAQPIPAVVTIQQGLWQPVQPINVNPGVRDWSSDTCGCFDDMSTCLCGTFCGGCLESRISQRLGENQCLPCCVPGGMVLLRTKMRVLLGIQGSACNDCLALACCGPCTICQMSRELDKAGIPYHTGCI